MLSNCESFYRRKLWTFNFTLYDSSDGSAHCVMWDESKAGRGGNEIASATLKWADSVLPNSTTNEITIWTDNCLGQNKNMSVIMCYFWILNKYSHVKVINHKFLKRGHTHMEADTVHALIERKTKQLPKLTILTPRDWQNVIRQTSKKFIVHNMELPDFKNFKSLYSGTDSPIVYRKTDVNREKLQLSHCIHLKVTQENIGRFHYKISSGNDFKEVDLRRNARKAFALPPTLKVNATESRPISSEKYNDILSLLKFLPTECHPFYTSLRHTKSAADYPGDDDD